MERKPAAQTRRPGCNNPRMSFTTRCPACGTMFRVVPDQLKISDGWVRCGHCSDVFDAMLNLQNETPDPETTPPPSTMAPSTSRVVARRVPIAPSVSLPSPTPPTRRPLIVRRSDPVPSPAPVAPAAAIPVPSPASASADDPPAAPAPDPSIDPGWDFASQFEELDEDPVADDNWDGEWLLSPQTMAQHREAVHQEMQSPAAPAPVAKTAGEDFERELAAFSASGMEDQPAAGPAAQDSFELPPSAFQDSGFEQEAPVPGFVAQGRRDAFWRRPALRAVLLLVATVLCALLTLQWAVHERDALAARYPATVPLLQAVCGAVGCSLAAPQRIDAVAIESSTLVRKLGQFYAFDLVVKNSESMAVAMPALELSLTDGRDKEVARRVFLPEEMPGTPAVVPAQGSLSVSMRLSLSESELSTMAGYRALVFYP